MFSRNWKNRFSRIVLTVIQVIEDGTKVPSQGRMSLFSAALNTRAFFEVLGGARAERGK